MKILVTGANGFIGSAFVRLALQQGHEIAGLVRSAQAIPGDLTKHTQATWMEGTLNQAPWPQIDAFKPEVCVHTAWIATPGTYLESPENHLYVRWSLDFLSRARDLGATRSLVLGTCIEYQPSNKILSEATAPLGPTSTYARCKNELRMALEKEGGFALCWGRVFYPYGVGEHPARLCTSLIQRIARKEKVVLKTPGSTKDYIYIDDLASAILTLVEKEVTGSVNLGTGFGVTVREIAATIANELGGSELIEEAASPAPDPYGFVVADARKLLALGWKPATNLVQGVRKLIASLQLT